jgi:hypothetical protein
MTARTHPNRFTRHTAFEGLTMHTDAIYPRQAPRLMLTAGQIHVGAPLRLAGDWPRRARVAVEDVFTLLALVLCVPFVILAIGVPIALFVQLLLRIGRLL